MDETKRSRVGAALVAVVEARVDAAPGNAWKETKLPASLHLQAARPLPPFLLSRGSLHSDHWLPSRRSTLAWSLNLLILMLRYHIVLTLEFFVRRQTVGGESDSAAAPPAEQS